MKSSPGMSQGQKELLAENNSKIDFESLEEEGDEEEDQENI